MVIRVASLRFAKAEIGERRVFDSENWLALARAAVPALRSRLIPVDHPPITRRVVANPSDRT